MIMLDKLRGVDLISRFPCVVTFGVALPFNEILELLCSPELSVCNYLFDLIFIFSIDEVRQWSGEVGTMGLCFMVWH